MDKYKIGYLDEEIMPRVLFTGKFKLYFDVDIIDEFDKIQTTKDLIVLINEHKLDALVVDYRISDKGTINYDGDEVITAMNKNKKFFPVIMMTSFATDASQKVDDVFRIFSKEDLNDSSKVKILADKIIKTIEKYRVKKDNFDVEIKALEAKKDLSIDEENKLYSLHLDLYEMDSEENPVPPQLLKSSIGREVTELLQQSKKVLKSLKEKDDEDKK
jgi:hypothetical protein